MSSQVNGISSVTPTQNIRQDDSAVQNTRNTQQESSAIEAPQKPVIDVVEPKKITRTDESKPLVDEGARLAEELQAAEAARDQLIAQKEQLAKQENTTEQPAKTMQEVMQDVTRPRYGTGQEDAGPLAEDSYFVSSNGANLDNAISALERQVALTKSKIDDIETAFSTTRDTKLSSNSEPVSSAAQAQSLAEIISADIKTTDPVVNISTITAKDGTDVLAILEV